ncbi:hypothetical protein BC831DRAFT_462392 [Entophlyctis helioformis]|nr:hypothetical protein BC831DRAFT_462392 [Entophlyctis helioformis]
MSMDGLGRTSSSDNLDMRTAHRRRGRRRTRAEKLPEQEFLKLVAAQTDIDVIRTMVGRRVEYLASHDYADRMTKMPFWQIALSRCPAIILTLTLELVVGAVIHKYAGLIKNNMMITSFMPVLSSIAGNVGLQASTATLRALSTGHASGSDLSGVYHILIKEFLASLVVASLSGIVLLSIAWSWAHSLQFGITTALGIFFNSSIAGIMGCLGPLTFKALRIDPALMAGPFETAMQDLIGSSVYLGIAAALLPWEP